MACGAMRRRGVGVDVSGLGRWGVLALIAVAIAGNYYAWDSIAPVADLLRRQRGLGQSQIGLLNAVYAVPNIPLSLVGGVLIDRIGAARASLLAAGFCFAGAVLTAIGEPFGLMVTGRLFFGIGEETLFISLLAGVAQWFSAGRAALAMALFFSMARVGSYLADISPRWAAGVYAAGWRPPLALAAALTGVSLVAAIIYLRIDRYRPAPTGEAPRAGGPASGAHESGLRESGLPEAGPPEPGTGGHGRFRWRDLTAFDRSFWYIMGLNVLFASVFFPFRSTFAIVYFQDAKGLSLADAGLVNSWVFFAAIFATPVFGLIADRFGRRAMLLTLGAALMPMTFAILGLTHWSLWISTVLMGLSFSVIPAVIWPSTAMLVAPSRLGTAFGLINVLQSLGMGALNLAAGWLNDRARAGPGNPAGYDPMLILFFAFSLAAFLAVAALWRRESGPHGHGLNAAAPAT
jgi:MFS family permease